MRRFAQILAVALFLFAPALVKADPVLIDFDSPLPSGGFYQAEGVQFVTLSVNPNGEFEGIGPGIRLLPSPAAVSPPNGAFAGLINPLSANINGISATFRFTGSELIPVTTPFVSFNVIGSQGTWTVLFFDETNQLGFDETNGLIGTITGNSDQVVTFSSNVGIRRFVFIPSTRNSLEGIDNLQFGPTSIPEPASLALLSFGIGGLLAHKRRKG